MKNAMDYIKKRRKKNSNVFSFPRIKPPSSFYKEGGVVLYTIHFDVKYRFLTIGSETYLRKHPRHT